MLKQTGVAMRGVCLSILLLCACAAPAQAIDEDRVLLLWNSESAESTAVRNAYLMERPGVRELDFAAANLVPGELTRAQYNNRIRTPLMAYLAGMTETGAPLAEHIVAIATTRGLPARISGPGEFTLGTERASIESEIALIHQNLDGTGQDDLPLRYDGIIDNPYHTVTGTPITAWSRSGITSPVALDYISFGGGDAAWGSSAMTPGHLYLVCRLDAGLGDTTTALEETIALIERSNDPAQMQVSFECVQALLDEFPASGGQLDDDGAPPTFPNDEDFERASSLLSTLGVTTQHDETFDFITGSELASSLPLLVLGTYGENHDVGGAGENPPGTGTYLQTYTPHPAGVMVSYESFSGNCLVNGNQRQGQACATDWIARGGSFVIPTVSEPFTFSIADLEHFVRGFYVNGMTFAEAAYASMPGLSWANVPVGDPLARVSIVAAGHPADFDSSGGVDGTDLAILLAAWGSPGGDVTGDGTTNGADLAVLLAAWGPVSACP